MPGADPDVARAIGEAAAEVYLEAFCGSLPRYGRKSAHVIAERANRRRRAGEAIVTPIRCPRCHNSHVVAVPSPEELARLGRAIRRLHPDPPKGRFT